MKKHHEKNTLYVIVIKVVKKVNQFFEKEVELVDREWQDKWQPEGRLSRNKCKVFDFFFEIYLYEKCINNSSDFSKCVNPIRPIL